MRRLSNVLKSKALEQLENLYLHGHRCHRFNRLCFGDEGAAAIAATGAAGGMPRLKKLSLYNNDIGAAGGAQALASAFAGGAFRELECLCIGTEGETDNDIGDAGLIALAAAFAKGALPNLKYLGLTGTKIRDEGLKALMAAAGGGGLPMLEELRIRAFGSVGYYIRWGEPSPSSTPTFGVESLEAITEAIENNNLPSLKKVEIESDLGDLSPTRQTILSRR